MRRTARPISRGSGLLMVVELTAIKYSRPAGPNGCRVAAANSGDPYNLVARQHHWPLAAAGAGNMRVAEEAFDLAWSETGDPHPIARCPASHRERFTEWQLGNPFI